MMVLKSLGFPEDFVGIVECLYGSLTEAVRVRSGVRKWCPLSPIIFICVMEPLVRYVMSDNAFKGMFVPGGERNNTKALCYMDDLSM